MQNKEIILIILIFFILVVSIILFLLKKNYAIYFILVTLFLEAPLFSFYFMSARIRIVQIIEVIILFCIIIRFFMNKFIPVKTPIDLPLIGYLLINLIAIINSPSLYRSLKISILMLSLVFLYFIICNYINNKELFINAFNLLLYVGLAESIYGLYQVVAGVFNHYLSTKLYIGYLGLSHAEFINAPWGRPYGTFVESDWYGTITMFYSLVFLSLYFSRLGERKKFYLFGFSISILGLVFSFVRAAWLGFIFGILLLLLLSQKVKTSRFNILNFTKLVSVLIIIILIVIIIVPSFEGILKTRFSLQGSASIFMQNTRFKQSIYSFRLFLKKPIIGNGPGSYSVLGIWGDKEEYYNQLVKQGLLDLDKKYDPNILTSILSETGILGFLLFVAFLVILIKFNIDKLKKISGYFQITAYSTFIGVLSLFISYIFTNGLWIPFTWVFLGFNICSLKLGLVENRSDLEFN